MTWSTVAIVTGRDDLEFRLVIEGWPYEFVTSSAMERTTPDGRERVAGLLRDGMRWSEQCDPAHGTIEAEGFAVQVVDRQLDDAVTRALASRPSVVAYLTADLASSTTSGNVAVTSIAGIATGSVVHLGTEAILIDTPSGTNLPFSVGGRGYWDSTAQSHYTGDGQFLVSAEVTDLPRSLEGRRATLYAYGTGQSLTANGTKVWRGVCATDAGLGEDGCTWSIQLDPITSVLDQTLCSDLSGDDIQPRGVFIPSTAPAQFRIVEYSTANNGGGTIANQTQFYVVGFFETQEEFCAQVNTSLASAITGWNCTAIYCVSDGQDGYHFELITGATARWVNVACTGPTEPSGLYRWQNGDATVVDSVTANSNYYGFPDPARGAAVGVGTVPRGWFGPLASTGYFDRDPYRPSGSAYPANIIYLGGAVALTSSMALDLELNGGSATFAIAAYDTTYRYVQVGLNGWRSFGIEHGLYTRENLPRIRLQRQLAYGSLADLRDALVTDGPTQANAGASPFVTSADLADWTAVVDSQAQSYPWATRRRWRTAGPLQLGDVLAEECKLIGAFPVIDSSGAIALAALSSPSATDASSRAIGADDVLVNDQRPTWERAGLFGAINTVSIKTGYDSSAEEHTGPTFVVRNVPQLAQRRAARVLEVAPVSEYAGDVPFDTDAAVALVAPVLGMFGADYSIVRVQVPLTCWSVYCGDYVALTDAYLPDASSGSRGLSGAIGLVIGRAWEVARGRGTLTVLLAHERVAGYSPAVRVTGAVNTSGTTWDLTVATTDEGGASLYAAGEDHRDHFAASDEIKLVRRDSSAPTTQTGSIDSMTATTITVTLDGAWAGLGGSTYWLRYADAASADASMRAYAYLAGTDDRVDFPTPVSATVFGA